MASDSKRNWPNSKEQEFNKDAPFLAKDADPQAFLRWKKQTVGFINTMFGMAHVLETLSELDIEKFIVKQHLKFQGIETRRADDNRSLKSEDSLATSQILRSTDHHSSAVHPEPHNFVNQDEEGENDSSPPSLADEDELEQAMRNGFAQGFQAANLSRKGGYTVIDPIDATKQNIIQSYTQNRYTNKY